MCLMPENFMEMVKNKFYELLEKQGEGNAIIFYKVYKLLSDIYSVQKYIFYL